MIRINLLPIKTSRRQEAVKGELVMAGVAAGAVLVVLLGLQFVLTSRVGTIEAENAVLNTELKQLEASVKDVENLEQMKADEVRHAQGAESAGAPPLAEPVRLAMRWVSKVMTIGAAKI